MKTKFLLFIFALIFSIASLRAAGFTVDGIAYYITSSSSPYTVEVNSKSPEYTGTVIIPEYVTYNSISYSVTSIGQWAFYDCSSLTSVIIPNSVTSIRYEAFYGCSGLTSVIIPNSVTYIENAAFEDCNNLTSITIPNSVTSIGNYTFSGCSSLTSITIPILVTSIGECAFWGCTGLTSITIPYSVTVIGERAFNGCGGLINVDSANPNYSSLDGVLFNKTQTALIQCPISKSGSYIIPNSVTSIGNGAFRNCTNLTSVIIPNSLTSIEYGAFYGCSGLTSVTIPNLVTSIGGAAFSGCSGLTSIYANSTTPVDFGENRNVFYNVDQDNCILYVPIDSKSLYEMADQWKEFENIVEHISSGIEGKTVYSAVSPTPNPATAFFILQGLTKETCIDIFDISGKKILNKAIQPDEKISVERWSKGVYVVKVNGKTGKLLVK